MFCSLLEKLSENRRDTILNIGIMYITFIGYCLKSRARAFRLANLFKKEKNIRLQLKPIKDSNN